MQPKLFQPNNKMHSEVIQPCRKQNWEAPDVRNKKGQPICVPNTALHVHVKLYLINTTLLFYTH